MINLIYMLEVILKFKYYNIIKMYIKKYKNSLFKTIKF